MGSAGAPLGAVLGWVVGWVVGVAQQGPGHAELSNDEYIYEYYSIGKTGSQACSFGSQPKLVDDHQLCIWVTIYVTVACLYGVFLHQMKSRWENLS